MNSRIETKNWNLFEIALRDWFIFLLDEGLAVSTANRYHVEISSAILILDEEIKLEQLDSIEIKQAYDSIINQKTSEGSRNYRAVVLSRAHGFFETRLGFSPLFQPLTNGEKSIPMVRAGYVSHSVYRNTLSSLQKIENLDSVTTQGLLCLLILAYRSGLRLSELIKLRLCDVEPSEESWLFIRNNPVADNKRDASLRKIPLNALLSLEESKIWFAYAGRRRRDAANLSELFFCHDGVGKIPLDSKLISRIISDAMRKVSDIPLLTFHDLRHTAISNMHAIAEREWALASQLTGYSGNQTRSVFRAVIGNDNEQLRVYWALAAFAGHNSPQTTLQSYVHFTDLISHLKISRNTVKLSLTQCRSLSGLSANKLTRIINKHKLNSETIPLEILRPYIINNLKIEFFPERTIEDNIFLSGIDDTLPTNRIKPTVAHKILSEYFKGALLPNLVYKYQVPEEKIILWITNVKKIAQLTTKKGAKRSNTQKDNVLPYQPISLDGQKEANEIIESLRNHYKSYRKNINWALEYFLNNSTKSNAGILFTTKEELSNFLKAFTPHAISVKRWRLLTKVPEL